MLQKNMTENQQKQDNNKKSVHFTFPEQVHWFEGVTEEEHDYVWFRRTDYVEFVEAELRRRQLLNQIEKTHRRRSSTGSEVAMKHTFSRKMVSRTISSGPPRRRRLPGRERNELDFSNHMSQYATKSKKKAAQNKLVEQDSPKGEEGTATAAATPPTPVQEKTFVKTPLSPSTVDAFFNAGFT